MQTTHQARASDIFFEEMQETRKVNSLSLDCSQSEPAVIGIHEHADTLGRASLALCVAKHDSKTMAEVSLVWHLRVQTFISLASVVSATGPKTAHSTT
jgi:hypothetical protein